MTNNEYWTEIADTAESLVAEAMDYCDHDRRAAEEYIHDRALFEAIDGHQWIIYNGYNLEVLQHSDNADYFEACIGGADEILREGGIDKLLEVMAFYAMYADVQDRLDDAFDAYSEA